MAKKTQKRIDGTFDKPPAPVRKAADNYVEAVRQKADWLTTMNERKEVLIEMMKEHDIAEIEIDEGEKKIVLSEQNTVKIKSVKQDKKADDQAV